MQNSGALSTVKRTIVLAGAGKMGSAMLHGWLAAGLDPSCAVVIDPHPIPDVVTLGERGLRINPEPSTVTDAAALVVAVKPQMFADAAAEWRGFVGAETVVVSIMAGQRIAPIKRAVGGAVIRAMPNTPAAIGRGMTVAVPDKGVSETQRLLAETLLQATGRIAWAEDEGLIDAVTAVSGSGPAYVFLLAEALARAGVAAGLPEDLSALLARETVSGAGELLHRSDETAEQLRKNVTSPNGTTAAALNVLMADDGLERLMTRAVDAATKRSRELGAS